MGPRGPSSARLEAVRVSRARGPLKCLTYDRVWGPRVPPDRIFFCPRQKYEYGDVLA